jgi:hypothetical protein
MQMRDLTRDLARGLGAQLSIERVRVVLFEHRGVAFQCNRDYTTLKATAPVLGRSLVLLIRLSV